MTTALTLTVRIAFGASASASTLDTVIPGNSASEKSHGVKYILTEMQLGALGYTDCRILPTNPPGVSGGTVSFTIRVSPVKQTYLTIKFWGGDHGEAAGRLLLFYHGKQIGYRNQGDYDVVNQMENTPLYPDRFVYETFSLPPGITRHKSKIGLTLSCIGPMWPYGLTYAQYQKPLVVPSRGVYAIYSGTSPFFVLPKGERRGHPPVSIVRPTPGIEVMKQVRLRVNSYLARYMMQPTTIKAGDLRAHNNPLLLLSVAYHTQWTTAYHNSLALARIVREGDAFATEQAANSAFVASDWQGAGGLGEAVMRVYTALSASKVLDKVIRLQNGDAITRRAAWAGVLLASVNYWRTHRRFYTNQSMIVDRNIYTANEGLRLLEPKEALPHSKVLDFLFQAAGIRPWLGSDRASTVSGGGADLPTGTYSHAPFGRHYYLVTKKGLSRELGYVGGYGETILHFLSDMVRLTHDRRLRNQLVKIELARAPFRYPLVDKNGYRAMFLESIIDNRVAHFPSSVAYTASDGARESEPMEEAAVTKDPRIAGIAQQCLADNQYFQLLQSRLSDNDPLMVLNLLRAVSDYAAVIHLPLSSYRLPMTPGQPDFVWADPEDAVIALKHGHDRLYVNFYYRSERAINGVVRLHYLTPSVERIVTAQSHYRYVPSGHTYVRPDWIDSIRSVGLVPPCKQIHQAWAGERMPIAKRPSDAVRPRYGDWGPFVGKASFYSLHYGPYLIAVNCSNTRTYTFVVPSAFAECKNLVTGEKLNGTKEMQLPPLTSVVLFHN